MAKIETTLWEIKNGGGVLLEDYLKTELQNSESELIAKEGIIYKIIEQNYRKKKKRIMEMLHDNENTLPVDIYDLYYENHYFFGYSMQFYEDYKTLYDVLKSNISLKERKKICLSLIQIYKELLSYKIVYFDWHSKNCVYGHDIKLLDIDSGDLTTSCSYDALARRNLFMLCLEILHGMDFDFDFDFSEEDIVGLIDTLVPKEEVILSKSIPLDFNFLEKEIKSYTKTKVEYQRAIILKK